MSTRARRWRRPLAAGALAVLALAAAGCDHVDGVARGASPNRGTVDYVIDGDTINVTNDLGESLRVRVLGINTPEVAHEGEAAQCGGDEAAAQLEKLLPEGTDVALIEDSRSDDEDRYGRLLRYVETPDDHTDVGAQLITGGYAYAWKPASAPRPDRWDDYEAATNEAQESQAGSWSTCPHLEESR